MKQQLRKLRNEMDEIKSNYVVYCAEKYHKRFEDYYVESFLGWYIVYIPFFAIEKFLHIFEKDLYWFCDGKELGIFDREIGDDFKFYEYNKDNHFDFVCDSVVSCPKEGEIRHELLRTPYENMMFQFIEENKKQNIIIDAYTVIDVCALPF